MFYVIAIRKLPCKIEPEYFRYYLSSENIAQKMAMMRKYMNFTFVELEENYPLEKEIYPKFFGTEEEMIEEIKFMVKSIGEAFDICF